VIEIQTQCGGTAPENGAGRERKEAWRGLINFLKSFAFLSALRGLTNRDKDLLMNVEAGYRRRGKLHFRPPAAKFSFEFFSYIFSQVYFLIDMHLTKGCKTYCNAF